MHKSSNNYDLLLDFFHFFKTISQLPELLRPLRPRRGAVREGRLQRVEHQEGVQGVRGGVLRGPGGPHQADPGRGKGPPAGRIQHLPGQDLQAKRLRSEGEKVVFVGVRCLWWRGLGPLCRYKEREAVIQCASYCKLLKAILLGNG